MPGVVAVHGAGGRDGRPGLAVVRTVLLVHPHDELPGGGVVHDLRPLDVSGLEFRVGGLAQDVLAELPGLEVTRPVGGHVAEGVVGVSVLAEPVVVLPHLDDATAVRLHGIAVRVVELCGVVDTHRCRLRGADGGEEGEEEGGKDGEECRYALGSERHGAYLVLFASGMTGLRSQRTGGTRGEGQRCRARGGGEVRPRCGAAGRSRSRVGTACRCGAGSGGAPHPAPGGLGRRLWWRFRGSDLRICV